MARMRPELSAQQLETLREKSSGEAKLYQACRKQLPDQYLILHSLEWIDAHSRYSPRDGETDFVIFDPTHGFLVIEVKGGGISCDPVHGQWETMNQHGRYDIKDPFHQAMEGKHVILKEIKKHPRWRRLGIRWVLTGHAVMFPDIDHIDALIAPERPREIIGSKKHLSDLRTWVAHVMAYWKGQDSRFQPLEEAGMRFIEDAFCKPLEIRPLISARLQEEEIIRIRLTEQQSHVLRVLGRRKRAAICGGAGTGKTLLAVQKAQQLANDGLQTLLLCYNRPLAEYLQTVVGEQPNLTAMSFHQLCGHSVQKVITTTGVDLREEANVAYPDGDFYAMQLPYALARSTELLPDRYDAIVIDEGQDFGEEFWLPIEELLRDPKESIFFIFFDQNQAIYQKVSTFPIQEEPFLLTVNCRNTRFIHDAAYHFFQGDPTEPPEIEGFPVGEIQAPSLSSQARRLHAFVTKLLNEEGVKANDIVILIADHHKVAYYDELNKYSLPHGSRWATETHQIPQSILLESVRRFKGLEAPIVFLWGIDDPTTTSNNEMLYVAFSRAKSRLYVVGSHDSCERILPAKAA